MFKITEKIIKFIEKDRFNFKLWSISFLAIISTRLLIESGLLGFPQKNLEGFVAYFSHTFLFFLLTYLLVLFFLKTLIKEKTYKISNFLLWGFWIVILPPIIDNIIFGNSYKSFYFFDSFQGLVVRFFTLFGKNPDWGITWGTRVNILISIFSIGIYVYIKTKNLKKVLISIIGNYTLFFLLSSFPSLVVFLIELFKTGTFLNVSNSTVAGYFLTPLTIFSLKTVAIESFLAKKITLIYLPFVLFTLFFLFFKTNKRETLCFLKNIRPAQIIFNLGILFIGMGLGYFYYPVFFKFDFFNFFAILNLILVVVSCWIFSVVVNDLNDLEIDKISNPQRPLINGKISFSNYEVYGWVFFFLSLFGAALISPLIFLIVLSYHLLTFVYSCYPFRLKKFIGISNFLISLASLNFLLIGFLVFSEDQSLDKFLWSVYWFLFIAYFLITPLKDLKDFEGDKKNKITTLPVLIGKKNTRLLIAGLLFSLYLSSVFVLKEPKLFLPALIVGGTSFFVVESLKIKEKFLNYWVLGLVFVYGLWLVKVVF
jgi:4-hydroxybenzoate polyprenyltransferase